MLEFYANQKNLFIGSPMTTRTNPELENLIGCFMDILPLKIKVEPNQLLADYFHHVSTEIIETQANRISFKMLIEKLTINKDISKFTVCQHLFNLPIEEIKVNPVFTKYRFIPETGPVVHDLEVFIEKTRPYVLGLLIFYTKLFRRETVQSFVDCYTKVLDQLAQYLELKKIDELNVSDFLQNL